MKINLYHPETGELKRIHHHDVDGWVEDGWLTSPPQPVEVEQPKKKTAKPSAPVDPE